MKKSVKYAGILCTALLLLAAASCGDAAENPTAPAVETAEHPVTATETEPSEPSEYIAPDVDFGGAEVCIAGIDYNKSTATSNWKAVNYCETFSDGENGDVLNDSIYQRNLAVSEQLNITITEYVLTELQNSGTEIRKLVMAGDDVIDYGMVTAYGVNTLLGSGLIYDLSSISTLDMSHSWWDQNAIDTFTMYGKTMVITGDISLYTAYSAICYFFNKQMFNDLDLDNPYQLVDDGKWTVDRVIEMCRLAARDLNGDGAMTEADSFGMLCEGTSMGYAALACGIRFTDKNADGIPQLALDVDRASTLVSKFGPFMADKNVNILAGNYAGKYASPFTELMLPLFLDNRGLFYNNQLLVALNLRDMNADFGILPAPKLDEAQQEYYCPVNTWWTTFAVVPKTNADAESTGYVLDAMGYYSQKILTPAFIDTTVRDKTLRDEDSSRMIELILANRVYDLANIYDFGSVQSMFSNFVTEGNVNIASKYAKVEKSANKAIDKLLTALQEE